MAQVQISVEEIKNATKRLSSKIAQNVQFCENNVGVYIVSPIHLHGSNLQPKVAVVHLPENVLHLAQKKYYFEKATLEVKQYIDPRRYEFSDEGWYSLLY